MSGEYVLALIMLPLTAAGFARFWHIRNQPIRSRYGSDGLTDRERRECATRYANTVGRPTVRLTKHGDTWR